MYKVDYHTHSSFSDGQPTYQQIIEQAKKLNMDSIAITDHFDFYDHNEHVRSITDEQLLEHFKHIREYANKIGQKVLCGIETCTDFYGNLRLNDVVVEQCDIIITSPHYIEYEDELEPGNYFDEKYWECYKEKVLNIAGGAGDILGHCEGYLPYARLLIPNTTTYEERQQLARKIVEKFLGDDYLTELIKALKKSGKALELHCVTATPRENFIERLVECSVPMSVGSDAHVLEWVGNTTWGLEMLKKYDGLSLQFIK